MSPQRRVGILACVALMLLAIVSPAFANELGNIRDEFNAIDYDGSDGSLGWAGPWLEAPLANGPGEGEIRVVTAGCAASGCLRIGPGNVTGQGVHREVDLSAGASATLTLTTRRQLDSTGGGSAYVAVSADGWLWTPVMELPMDVADADPVAHVIDVSDWSGRTVKVGLFGTGVFGGYLFVDDVDILLSSNALPEFNFPLVGRNDNEGDSIVFAVPASDPDGASLRFSATGLPAGVSLDPVTGVVSGTIGFGAAAVSPYATVITVTDGDGGASSQSFVWAVADVNRPPTLDVISDQSVDELATMTVQLTADDPDLPDDALRYRLTRGPAGAAINASGEVTWTPGEMAGPGRHSFVVRVEDSAVPPGSAERTFTVDVAEVNTAPQITPIPDMALRAGDSVSYYVEYADADLPANKASFSATGLPAGTRIDADTGLISGSIPTGRSPESGTVVVTVVDNGYPAARATETFSWQVGTGNRPPVLEPIPQQELDGDGEVSFVAAARDADEGDVVKYWLAAGIDPIPDGAAIDAATGEFRWTPTPDQHGATYRINVGASDSGSPRLSATQLVTIVVPQYNEAPEIGAIPDQTAAEGDIISLQIDAGDANPNNTIRYAAANLPPGLSIDAVSGLISGEVNFTAAADSPFAVVVTATDDGVPARSSEREFAWTVGDTNRPPQVADSDIVVLVGVPRDITLPAIDPDDDPLEYRIVDPPLFGFLEGDAPDLVYTGVGDRNDEFKYVVSDGEFEVEATVAIELRLSNDPPRAALDEYSVDNDGALRVPAPGVLGNDVDPDAEVLRAVIVAPPDHGDLSLLPDGSFTYRPEAGYVGADKFTYAAVDALGEQSIATVVVTIGGTAETPTDIAPAAPSPPSRGELVAAGVGAWTPVEGRQSSLVVAIRHGAGFLLSGVMDTVAAIRFPIILLSVALALMLAFGSVSLIGATKTEGEGEVGSFDPGTGLGRLIADGEEIVIHRHALQDGVQLRPGQRVEFIAAMIRNRRIATKIWPTT